MRTVGRISVIIFSVTRRITEEFLLFQEFGRIPSRSCSIARVSNRGAKCCFSTSCFGIFYILYPFEFAIFFTVC